MYGRNLLLSLKVLKKPGWMWEDKQEMGGGGGGGGG